MEALMTPPRKPRCSRSEERRYDHWKAPPGHQLGITACKDEEPPHYTPVHLVCTELMTIMGAGAMSLVSRTYASGSHGVKIEMALLSVTLKDPFEEIMLPALPSEGSGSQVVFVLRIPIPSCSIGPGFWKGMPPPEA